MRRHWRISAIVAGLLAGCDTGMEPPLPADLELSDVTLEARGEVAQLTARAGGVVVGADWESLDPSVVSVTTGGLATAVGAGSARVRASFAGVTEGAIVHVMPPVDIRVSDLAVVTDGQGRPGMRMRLANLGGRGFYRLEFWAYGPDGAKQRILSNANEIEAAPDLDVEHRSFLTDRTAEWVVAFSREPVSEQSVRTSCARLDGELEPCPSDLPDTPAATDSVAVWPAAAVLDVGDTVQFTAKAFAGGVERTDRTVVWTTPSPNVISITDSGLVVALRSGYGQVNATVDGVTAGVGLTVTSEPSRPPVARVAYVHLTPRQVRLWVGQGWGMSASAYDSAGAVLEDRIFSWSVDDDAVAVLDSRGLLTTVGPGRTRVVATSEGVSGYAALESYARPDGAADLAFRGLLPASEDPSTVEPSIPTTWVDRAGVTHDAWIQVGPGGLSLTWTGDTGRYTQRLTLSTYVRDPVAGVRKVAETEYVDEGTLERWWDYAYGREYFDFTSATTEGLTYRASWTLPGELAVEQTVGAFETRHYYFRLEL